jgi:hypothetical protein
MQAAFQTLVAWLASFSMLYLLQVADAARAAVYATIVACLAMCFLGQGYVREVARAKRTVLLLGPDAMIIREDSVERRYYYTAIELLVKKRPRFGEAWLIDQLENGIDCLLYGYSDMPRLISLLSQKVPKERQRGFT